MGLDPALNSSQDDLSDIDRVGDSVADPDIEAMVFLDDQTRSTNMDGDYDETLKAAINNSGFKFERESQ